MLSALLVRCIFGDTPINRFHQETLSKQFRITHWTTDNGLPQNRISALAQTSDGYLWIGTWFGVVRFDGLRFTIFNRYNTPELASDVVSALAASPDGALWVATRDGLVQLNGNHWSRFTTEDGLPSNLIWDLLVDLTGTLWISTDRQMVGRFPGGPFIQLTWNENGIIPARFFVTLPTGVTAVLTPEGPCALTNINQHIPNLRLRDPAFWPGEHRPVWEPQAERSVPEIVHRDKKGTVWAGFRNGGLHRLDSGYQPVHLLENKRQPGISAFLDDREGNLWIGTDAGLFQLRPRSITSFTQTDGLPDNDTWSVAEGPNETIWIATKGGPACIKNDQVFPGPRVKRDEGKRCILPGRNGTIWMDTYDENNSLLEIIPENSRQIHCKGESPQALYLDVADRLWAGTTHGVRCFHGGTLLPLDGLPEVEVRFSLQSHNGSMWFGSRRDGLFHWHEGNLQQFTTRDRLADNFIIALHEDSDRILWIATANGLNRFDLHQKTPQFFTFTTHHGLLDNLINYILEDDQGFLWFSSNRGISRIARADLNAVAQGRKAEVACVNFGTADGMESSETNGEHQPAGCKATDGRLWFPTTIGVVVIDPKQIPTSEVPPGIVIEQVKADREIIFGTSVGDEARPVGAWMRSLTSNNSSRRPSDISIHTANPRLTQLPPGRARVLEIRYTATSFIAPEKIRFKYKLDGHDPDWRTAESNERVAFYTNLRPGNYNFRVKACNSHGCWNEEGASFAFSLAPSFTQTLWFPVLCALGLISVTAAFALWRLRWQRQILIAEQSAKLEHERARIARDLHDDLGTALTGIALEAELAEKSSSDVSHPSDLLHQISCHCREVADRMREVVWAVNPRCDTVESLVAFLSDYALSYLAKAGIACRFDLPKDTARFHLRSEARHELFLMVKELLHNVVKHSRATEVRIKLSATNELLELVVHDNGCGFTQSRSSNGNGLQNLKERARSLSCEFNVGSVPNLGTTATLRLPLHL